jgi:hypothetical protein
MVCVKINTYGDLLTALREIRDQCDEAVAETPAEAEDVLNLWTVAANGISAAIERIDAEMDRFMEGVKK